MTDLFLLSHNKFKEPESFMILTICLHNYFYVNNLASETRFDKTSTTITFSVSSLHYIIIIM